MKEILTPHSQKVQSKHLDWPRNACFWGGNGCICSGCAAEGLDLYNKCLSWALGAPGCFAAPHDRYLWLVTEQHIVDKTS